MTNILKHAGNNIGGIIPIWWCFDSDVASQTIDKKTLSCAITMRSGKKWSYLYGTNDTIELDSEETEKPAGTQYTYKLKMMLPQDRPEVEIALREMENRGLIIHCTDKNGVIRILGVVGNGMRKAGKLKKPSNVEGFNGWEITFQGTFSLPAFYGSELADADKNALD